jgi:hypothetical protein
MGDLFLFEHEWEIVITGIPTAQDLAATVTAFPTPLLPLASSPNPPRK